MNTRSKKILKLAEQLNKENNPVKNLRENNLIFLPKYETTKGTSLSEKMVAIQGEKSSGSEYIPDSDEISSKNGKGSEKHFYLNCNPKKKIKILQDITLMTKNEQQSVDDQLFIKERNADKLYVMQKYFKTLEETENMNNTTDNQTQIDVAAFPVDFPIIQDTALVEHSAITRINRISKENITSSFQERDLLTVSSYPKICSENCSEIKTELANQSTVTTENDNLRKSDCNSADTDQDVAVSNKQNRSEETSKTINTSNSSLENSYRKINPINNIEIKSAAKQNGKRIRNKTHVCYFCGKMLLNMARHFELVHKNESEVSKYLAYPKKSKQRRNGFGEIIRVGDFYHNCNVLATKGGELILIRRPTENESQLVSDSDYGPCPNCLGFLLKKHIWHHLKWICKEKSELLEDTNSKHIIAESNAIMSDGLGFTKDFTETIIASLKSDSIGNICKNDILILKFGAMQFEKFGRTQNELIRQTMRQLGRLVIALKELYKNALHTLSDFLVPEKFDIVVQATKNISMSTRFDDTCRPEYQTPSLALKLGYTLKKYISIERGVALRSGNLKRNRSLLSFLHLMNIEWSIRISSNALSTLQRRKINSTELLPITNDLVKLNKHIDESILTLKHELETSTRTNQTWTKLATLVLARIILFNKRRSGEAARMKMSDYISRPLWTEQNTDETKLSLTPVEQKLAENLALVEIEGKRGRKVPVVLSPMIKECIDILIKHRDECNISFYNKYVFARSNGSLSYLRGHDCLKKICDEIDLQNPSIITGTKLRKYIATVCQLFNMTENECDWLARHLGHDIRVHRNFYRMHENAIELTKISRILLAVDNGEAYKYTGKNIDQIDIKDLPALHDEEDQEIEENENISENNGLNENELEPGIAIGDKIQGKEESIVKKRIVKKIKQSVVHKVWSQEEKEAVLSFFKLNIKKSITPGKQQCMDCIEKHPVLSSRDWKKIKYFVKNQTQKIKKMK